MDTPNKLDAKFNPATNLVLDLAQTPGYHTQIADGTPVHETRKAMDYALSLLQAGTPERVARAHAVIDAVLKLQVTDPLDKHFGIWGWFAEEPPSQMNPADWNWADFLGARIAQMLVCHAALLDDAITVRLKTALDRAAMCIFRRQTPAGYTNIAIMGASVAAAAGEIVGRPVLLEYGRNKMQAVLDLARQVGTFSEYNSPTYTMVAIDECERALRITRDPALHASARQLLEVAWDMVADHWHSPTQQWAGPHGRAYSDRVSESTRARILTALGERATRPVTTPRMVSVPLEGDVDGEKKVMHTWLAPTCCISSVTREHTWTQRRQIIAYWNASQDVAVFKVQFLMDGREMPGMRLATSHAGNRILLSAYPLHHAGAWHPNFGIPEGSIYEPSDLRFRFLLEAPGAGITQLAPTRYELSAGDHAVRIDTAAGEFDGQPIRWSIHREDARVAVDAICIDQKRSVCFETLMVRLAVGLQLLAPGSTPIDAPVTLQDESENRVATWSDLAPVTVPIAAKPFGW